MIGKNKQRTALATLWVGNVLERRAMFMWRLHLGSAIVLSATVLALDGRADDDEPWFQWDSATGGWGGARDTLEKAGVKPEANYTTDNLGNPIGGLNQSVAYAGMLEASIDVDLGELAGIPGLTLFIAGAWTSGRSLSADDIGNVFPVSQVFNGDTVRLNQLYLQQSLFGDALDFAVGRLATNDDFAASPVFANYVSAAVNSVPIALPTNVPSFTSDPFTAWGTRVIGTPDPRVFLGAGVYNADPGVQDDDEHGVDFRLNPEDGVLIVGEIGYERNQRDGDTGLPGMYHVGGYYDTSKFDALDGSGGPESGNAGLYAVAHQMVYREEGTEDQGLTPWVAATYAPNQDINTLPVSVSGGLFYKGAFKERKDDITAFAFYYGQFSSKLDDQSSETVLEINHRLQMAEWLYVTLDLQYIFRPNGDSTIDDALVIGGELSIDF